MVGMILLIVIFVILSGTFSAIETAYSSVSEIRIKQLARSNKKGSKRAKLAYWNLTHYSGLISTILVLNNIVNLASSSITSYLFVTTLGLGENGVLISTAAISIIIIILGEILPKTIARLWPEFISITFALPLKLFIKILTPITYWFSLVDKKLTSIADDGGERVTATENELIEIVDTIEREGVLEHTESELVKSALNFDEITVKSVMLDKEYVTELPSDASFEEAVDLFRREKYSRVPVVDKETEKVIGILLQYDVFSAQANGENPDVLSLLKEPIYVSYRKKISYALQMMQGNKFHMAVVVDNLREKNYMGLVTMEDILEEIVGEIYDEFDDLPANVVRIGNDSFEVSGGVSIEYFFDEYLNGEVEEPKTKCTQIGPWVKSLLGDSAYTSEIFYENLKFEVLEHDDLKIKKVIITVVSAFEEKEI